MKIDPLDAKDAAAGPIIKKTLRCFCFCVIISLTADPIQFFIIGKLQEAFKLVLGYFVYLGFKMV